VYLSQTKAGELAGVSRGTIANRIKDGVLSETHEGIEVSELVRVFPHITPDDIEQIKLPAKVREKRNKQPANADDSMSVMESRLFKRLEQADSLVADYQKRLDEQAKSLAERDNWFKDEMAKRDEKDAKRDAQLQRLTALLEAPKVIAKRNRVQRLGDWIASWKSGEESNTAEAG